MSVNYINHSNLVQFAREKVNLPKEKADEYRAQAKRLQDKLAVYLNAHPDFNLRRMILSGSLAKGTALKTLNDIDVGCYITGVETTISRRELIKFLAEKLGKAFPNFTSDQITIQTHCVTVNFRGSGLDVDIVPIIYNNDPEWYGHLFNRRSGTLLKTNIPYHLEFIRKRKSNNNTHFSQVVRLLKFWVKKMKAEKEGFRFKSFMVELVLAKLADDGLALNDYPEAMQHFFTYIAKSDIRELISFDDYYSISELGHYSTPVKIIDPVNAKNNAADLYTNENADAIVKAALEAGDAIDAASYATTKGKAIEYWQKVFGPSFTF